MQVGPYRWHQYARSIRKHEHEQQFAVSMLPGNDFQRAPLERMAASYDGHPFGVAVEVVMMGIVSSVPSTE
jgi:hypothetical protein